MTYLEGTNARWVISTEDKSDLSPLTFSFLQTTEVGYLVCSLYLTEAQVPSSPITAHVYLFQSPEDMSHGHQIMWCPLHLDFLASSESLTCVTYFYVLRASRAMAVRMCRRCWVNAGATPTWKCICVIDWHKWKATQTRVPTAHHSS